MNDFVMRGGDPQVLLSHVALYGLAAILEDGGAQDLRVDWNPGMRPRPRIHTNADDGQIGAMVKAHAESRAADGDWLQRDVTLRGSPRGLMSPRLTPFDTTEIWQDVQHRRHDVIDELTAAGRWLDLRFIAALGEPSYWSRNREETTIQDDGASRLEMQPRNQGSEIVGSRLRKLSAVVGSRSVERVVPGLSGVAVQDEIGGDKTDSRTPTGLASPGPTDNALAWCALWGLSQFPLAMRTGTRGQRGIAATSGHVGRKRKEWFYVPIWQRPWRTARLRSVLVSEHLRVAACDGLDADGGRRRAVTALQVTRAHVWLRERGVVGVVRFPIAEFGSDSAPERRAMRGVLLPTGALT